MYDWCMSPELGDQDGDEIRVFEKKTKNDGTLKIVINTKMPDSGE